MNIQVPVRIKPIPFGDIDEYFLSIKKGTKIKEVLPDNFNGIVYLNNRLLNISHNPVIKETDEIEFLIPLSGGGGGGKDTLRSVAFVAVAIAASVATGGISNVWLRAGAAIALNVAGGALINTLIPPQMPEEAKAISAADSVPGFSTKSLTASQNKPGSYSIFPKLYGERRFKPYYAASPYTEIVGDDQYLHFLFFLNFGPISVLSENGSTRLIAGLFSSRTSGLRDYYIERTNLSSSQLETGTVKIDETSLETLDDWRLIIGSPNKIQESTGFRDAEVAYPNISFEAGYTYQTEPFNMKNKDSNKIIGLKVVQTKIIDLKDVVESKSISFSISSNPDKYSRVFSLSYELLSEYGSENWKTLKPKTNSIFYNGDVLSGDLKYLWFAANGNYSYTSGIIEATGIIGRIKINKCVYKSYDSRIGGGDLSFDSFKFYEDDYAVYTTAPNSYGASVDIVATNGLYYIDAENQRKKLEIKYSVEYRPIGSSAWQLVKADRVIGSGLADNTAKQLMISGNSAKTYRAGLYFEFPDVGQYDVRITPIYKTSFGGFAQESVTWETLKSYQSKGNAVWAPFLDDLDVPTNHPDYNNLKRNCVLMYLKIKAQPTLQGNADNISIKCASVLKDISTYLIYGDSELYHSNANLDACANPANIYLDILLGGGLVNNISMDKIDTDSIGELYDFCVQNDFYYHNYEVNEETSLNRINKALSVAFAKFGTKDRLLSILRDEPDQTPIQVITPANCNSFSASKSFNKRVHGVKVQYTDKSSWETNYVIVYNTGYSLDGSGGTIAASEFITLDVEGITDIEQAKKYGRYHLAAITLRPETYMANMDIENIRIETGDCVYIAYDTINVGEIYGTVKGINRNGSNEVVYIETAELVTDIQAGKGICFRLQNGSSFLNTYPVNESLTTETKIYLETPTAIDLNIGDIFTYGDIDSEKIKAKVTGIYPGKDLSADIEMVNAADEIHQTYTSGTIPSYVPVIDGRSETGLLVPPSPVPTAIDSGDNFVVTGEAIPESFCIKIDFTIPYTQIGVDNIVIEYIAQYYETVDLDEAVFETGVFEEGVFEALSSSAIKKEIRNKIDFAYTGQNYILFEALQNADYEIKIYSNKKSNGKIRVSSPYLIEYSTTSGTVSAVSGLNYVKEVGKNIQLVWSDPQNNFPTIFRIFEYDSGSSDWLLIGTTQELIFDIGKRFVESQFAVRAVNLNNNNRSDLSIITINEPKPLIGNVNGRTLDGKIEIYWTSQNIEIDEYEIREGTEWEDGVLVGKTKATSILIPKTDDGIYNFMVMGHILDGQETEISTISYHYPYGEVGEKPSEKPGLKWQKDLVVYVGTGEIFETLEDALEYFAGLYVGYSYTNPYRVYIYLQNGYTFTRPIKIENFDFGFITITGGLLSSQYVDFESTVDSVGFYNNGNETFQCKPLFYGLNSIMPVINSTNFIFKDNANTNGTSLCCLNNSSMEITNDISVTFENYGNFGFYLTNGSKLMDNQSLTNYSDWQFDNIKGLCFYTKKSEIELSQVSPIFNALTTGTSKTGFLVSDNSKVNINDTLCDAINFFIKGDNNSDIYISDFFLTDCFMDYPSEIESFISALNGTKIESCCTDEITADVTDNKLIYADNKSSVFILNGTLMINDDVVVEADTNSSISFYNVFDPGYPYIIIKVENNYSIVNLT